MALEEKVVDLASDESCGKAVAKLARQHPGADVGRTSALRMLHRHGASACEFIEEKLADITEQMEVVIQKYLRNEYESIGAYNAEAEVAEPYRFVVAANFPPPSVAQAASHLAH